MFRAHRSATAPHRAGKELARRTLTRDDTNHFFESIVQCLPVAPRFFHSLAEFSQKALRVHDFRNRVFSSAGAVRATEDGHMVGRPPGNAIQGACGPGLCFRVVRHELGLGGQSLNQRRTVAPDTLEPFVVSAHNQLVVSLLLRRGGRL